MLTIAGIVANIATILEIIRASGIATHDFASNRQYRLKPRDTGAAHAPLVSSMTGTSLLGADLVAGELMPELPCGFSIWQVK